MLNPLIPVAKELEANPSIKEYVRRAFERKKEEIRKAVELTPPSLDLGEYVVVSNLPIISKEKEEQFIKVFLTISQKLGLMIERAQIIMPFKPEGKENYGCMFIKCADVKTADSIATKLYNIKVGKNAIKAVIMADFDRRLASAPIEEHSFSKVSSPRRTLHLRSISTNGC